MHECLQMVDLSLAQYLSGVVRLNMVFLGFNLVVLVKCCEL